MLGLHRIDGCGQRIDQLVDRAVLIGQPSLGKLHTCFQCHDATHQTEAFLTYLNVLIAIQRLFIVGINPSFHILKRQIQQAGVGIAVIVESRSIHLAEQRSGLVSDEVSHALAADGGHIGGVYCIGRDKRCTVDVLAHLIDTILVCPTIYPIRVLGIIFIKHSRHVIIVQAFQQGRHFRTPFVESRCVGTEGSIQRVNDLILCVEIGSCSLISGMSGL